MAKSDKETVSIIFIENLKETLKVNLKKNPPEFYNESQNERHIHNKKKIKTIKSILPFLYRKQKFK